MNAPMSGGIGGKSAAMSLHGMSLGKGAINPSIALPTASNASIGSPPPAMCCSNAPEQKSCIISIMGAGIPASAITSIAADIPSLKAAPGSFAKSAASKAGKAASPQASTSGSNAGGIVNSAIINFLY